MRDHFPVGARIAFAMTMLFVLTLSGMINGVSKASASAMHGSGFTLFCDPASGSDSKGSPASHHCDACLFQAQRDPAPDLSMVEGIKVPLPTPIAQEPVVVLADDQPLPTPLITRRSTPPRAPPVNS